MDQNLRDYTCSITSSPVKSPALAKLFRDSTSIKRACAPRLHSKHEVQEIVAHSDGAKRLTRLCQKPPGSRTEQEVSYIQGQVSGLVPFFRLWPEALQHELARMLQTEVLVRRESVIARATIPSRLFFVLDGKLSVVVPGSPSPTGAGPASSEPDSGQAGDAGSRLASRAVPSNKEGMGEEGTRVLAVLKRGDSCGEAALLGTAVAHADVVVSSQGAVLLALSKTDFLHALKAILGLRQQARFRKGLRWDRLLYLRLHPLFHGVTLGDIDLLADALQVSLYPPGSLLLPRRPGELPRVYLIAEGTAVVRRGGPAGSAARRAAIEEGARIAIYDGDTISVLQPQDIIGSHLPHGHIVEADTQVKAYWLDSEQMAALPERLRVLLEMAQGFKSQYFAGRLSGLQQLDRARRSASYGSYTYKVGDVVMTAGMGSAPVDPAGHGALASSRPPSSPLSSGAQGGRASPYQWRAPNRGAASTTATVPLSLPPGSSAHPGSLMSQLLGTLSLQQVITALDLSPTKDKRTGLPLTYAQEAAHHLGLPLRSGPGQQGAGASLGGAPLFPTAPAPGPPCMGAVLRPPSISPVRRLPDSSDTESPSLSQRPSHQSAYSSGTGPTAGAGNIVALPSVFLTQLPMSERAAAAAGGSTGPGPAGASAWQDSPPRPSRQAMQARTRSPWDHGPPDHAHTSHELGPGCALHTMPPDVKAWARVEHGLSTRVEVKTEVPRAQPVPVTLRSRHTELFARAKAALLTRPTTRDPYGYSDAGDEDDDDALYGSQHETGRQPSRRLSGDKRSRTSRSSSFSAQQQHTWHSPRAQPNQQSPHHYAQRTSQTQPPGHSHAAQQGQGLLPGAQRREGSGRSHRPQSARSAHAPPLTSPHSGFDGQLLGELLPPAQAASTPPACPRSQGPGAEWPEPGPTSPFAAQACLEGSASLDSPAPARGPYSGPHPGAGQPEGGCSPSGGQQGVDLNQTVRRQPGGSSTEPAGRAAGPGTGAGAGAGPPRPAAPQAPTGGSQHGTQAPVLHGMRLRPHNTKTSTGQEKWAGDIWEEEGAPGVEMGPGQAVAAPGSYLSVNEAAAPGATPDTAALTSPTAQPPQGTSSPRREGRSTSSSRSPPTAGAKGASTGGSARRPASPQVRDGAQAGPRQASDAPMRRKAAPPRLGPGGKSEPPPLATGGGRVGATSSTGAGAAANPGAGGAAAAGLGPGLEPPGAQMGGVGEGCEPGALPPAPPHTGDTGGISLPPSVLLGYEMLTPMSWAALMSHASGPMRAGGQQTQEKILPPPKW